MLLKLDQVQARTISGKACGISMSVLLSNSTSHVVVILTDQPVL